MSLGAVAACLKGQPVTDVAETVSWWLWLEQRLGMGSVWSVQ